MVFMVSLAAWVQGGCLAILPSTTSSNEPWFQFLIPWARGRQLIWDFTCSDTYAGSHISKTRKLAGAAAAEAEHEKFRTYDDLSRDYTFVPIAVETSGVFGDLAFNFVKQLGRLISFEKNDPRTTSYLFQRISLSIQRGNAASILGSIPSSRGLDEIFNIL